MLFADADLDRIFEATGEKVTLGGLEAMGVVRSADADELLNRSRRAYGTPAAVGMQIFEVLIKSGALGALTTGATVVIRGQSYIVDAVRSMTGGQCTKFDAYPKAA